MYEGYQDLSTEIVAATPHVPIARYLLEVAEGPAKGTRLQLESNTPGALLLGESRLLIADSPTSPPTLLLVDDDPKTLRALALLLDGDGYRVLTALSAEKGFELLALEDVHVILCDERMPGMTGTEFLNRVKDLHPDALRLMLSGYADDDSLIGAINRGEVYRYYTKPWDAEQLREGLREAFRHYHLLHEASRGDDKTAAPPLRLVGQPA